MVASPAAWSVAFGAAVEHAGLLVECWLLGLLSTLGSERHPVGRTHSPSLDRHVADNLLLRHVRGLLLRFHELVA